MRIIKLFLLAAFTLSLFTRCFCQEKDLPLIRSLEERERQAILKGDTSQLSILMSRNILVQNPENTIVGFRQVIDRIRTGKISYSVFERRIDTIAFMNNVAIVMGLETLISKDSTGGPGKTIQRRFTNVWMKESEGWKLTARQATIIPSRQ